MGSEDLGVVGEAHCFDPKVRNTDLHQDYQGNFGYGGEDVYQIVS